MAKLAQKKIKKKIQSFLADLKTLNIKSLCPIELSVCVQTEMCLLLRQTVDKGRLAVSPSFIPPSKLR